MDKQQLIQGLKGKEFSKPILDAISKVPRERFMLPKLEKWAYEDRPLPIGQGQTISQPYTIALMLKMLKLRKGQKALEIGSGCGYVLALINEITKSKVYGVERIKQLWEKSKDNLKNYNVEILNGNGYKGFPKFAPYDKILISCAVKQIPEAVLNQLKDRGILVAPMDIGKDYEIMVSCQKTKNKLIVKEQLDGFRFVPFIDDK